MVDNIRYSKDPMDPYGSTERIRNLPGVISRIPGIVGNAISDVTGLGIGMNWSNPSATGVQVGVPVLEKTAIANQPVRALTAQQPIVPVTQPTPRPTFTPTTDFVNKGDVVTNKDIEQTPSQDLEKEGYKNLEGTDIVYKKDSSGNLVAQQAYGIGSPSGQGGMTPEQRKMYENTLDAISTIQSRYRQGRGFVDDPQRIAELSTSANQMLTGARGVDTQSERYKEANELQRELGLGNLSLRGRELEEIKKTRSAASLAGIQEKADAAFRDAIATYGKNPITNEINPGAAVFKMIQNNMGIPNSLNPEDKAQYSNMMNTMKDDMNAFVDQLEIKAKRKFTPTERRIAENKWGKLQGYSFDITGTNK